MPLKSSTPPLSFPINPTGFPLKTFLLYIFVALVLFQNLIGLFFSAINFPTAAIKLVFIFKEALIPVLALLIIFPSFKLKNFSATDKWALLYIAATAISGLHAYSGIKTSLMQIKFYLFPVFLYFIGKHLGYIVLRKNINKILSVMVIAFIGFSIFYYCIGFGILQDLNIKGLFNAKGSGVDEEIGLPLNYYSRFGGHLYIRCIGPFLDPLTSGFFALLLLFYMRFKPKKGLDYILYAALIFTVFLTLTRAVIGAFLITLLFTRIRNGRFFFAHKTLLAIGVIIILAIGLNINYLLSIADPSTWGHLYAYKSHVEYLFSHPFGLGYFRQSGMQPEELQFGPTESIFLTMALENGIPLLIIFLFFLYSLHRFFQRHSYGTIQFVAYSSFIGYLIASLTTEHLFAVTSCGLFWIYCGFAVADAEARKRSNYEVKPLSVSNLVTEKPITS